MNNNLREAMNAAYVALDKRGKDILRLLKVSCSSRPLSCGYFAGHYWPVGKEGYQMDQFPIPVVTVEGLCDIEIDLEFTGITAKLSKQALMSLDHAMFNDIPYTVYGVMDFEKIFKGLGETPECLAERIQTSDETAFFYSFLFSADMSQEQILTMIKNLEQLKLYC